MCLLQKILKTNLKYKVIVNQCLKNKTNKLRKTSSYNIWLLLRYGILLERFQEPVDQFLLPSKLNLSITVQNFHWAMESFLSRSQPTIHC